MRYLTALWIILGTLQTSIKHEVSRVPWIIWGTALPQSDMGSSGEVSFDNHDSRCDSPFGCTPSEVVQWERLGSSWKPPSRIAWKGPFRAENAVRFFLFIEGDLC